MADPLGVAAGMGAAAQTAAPAASAAGGNWLTSLALAPFSIAGNVAAAHPIATSLAALPGLAGFVRESFDPNSQLHQDLRADIARTKGDVAHGEYMRALGDLVHYLGTGVTSGLRAASAPYGELAEGVFGPSTPPAAGNAVKAPGAVAASGQSAAGGAQQAAIAQAIQALGQEPLGRLLMMTGLAPQMRQGPDIANLAYQQMIAERRAALGQALNQGTLTPVQQLKARQQLDAEYKHDLLTAMQPTLYPMTGMSGGMP